MTHINENKREKLNTPIIELLTILKDLELSDEDNNVEEYLHFIIRRLLISAYKGNITYKELTKIAGILESVKHEIFAGYDLIQDLRGEK